MSRKPAQKPRSKSANKPKAANSSKRSRGRPSDFKPEYCEQAEKLCKLLNATEEDLAEFFEKGLATISRWKVRHAEFREALKRGKILADMGVAERMHESAEGFEWDEQQAIKLKTVEYENGKRVRESERVEIVTVHRVKPPDTMAGMYWLNNRQGGKWRQRQEITGKDGGPVDVNLNEVRGAIASKLGRIARTIPAAGVPR